MTAEGKRAALRSAYNHNATARAMASCNRAYMGSLATHSLAHILGGDGASLFAAIAGATETQLDAGIAYCQRHGYLR